MAAAAEAGSTASVCAAEATRRAAVERTGLSAVEVWAATMVRPMKARSAGAMTIIATAIIAMAITVTAAAISVDAVQAIRLIIRAIIAVIIATIICRPIAGADITTA
jgi:hypothetical protein